MTVRLKAVGNIEIFGAKSIALSLSLSLSLNGELHTYIDRRW
ncbi:hypothetical protein HanPI659440_Chr08g0289891 [Helianthus annuus]|nr:hypothetical protein HanPI659440_Chr08g0289891 [Helianthus annuus]